MAGCENPIVPPVSDEYFTALGTEKLVILLVDVGLTVVIFVLFAEECHFVVRTTWLKHRDIAIKSIWLISIYPVFALSSVLSVLIPRAMHICDFVATCYLSACLLQFSSLLMLYFGSLEHLLVKIKDTGLNLRARPCCCCCLCCPVLPPVRRSVVIVRMMILQTAVLQPIIQFIAAVLWADDKFNAHAIDFTDSYVYLTILKLISTIMAVYGLRVLHTSAQPHLLTHNTRPKYVALSLVQLFSNVQGSLLLIPAKFDVPPCKDGFTPQFQMREWHHLVLVVEMFLLSVLARVYYRRPLALDAILEMRNGDLPDIYVTPDVASARNEADADATQLEATPGTVPLPHQAEENIRDSKSLPQIPESQTRSMEKNAEDHGVEWDQFHLIVENNVGGALGSVNPVFYADTTGVEETERRQTNATFSSGRENGTTQTSVEMAHL